MAIVLDAMYSKRKKYADQSVDTPSWIELVNELKSVADTIKNKKQLDEYLLQVDDLRRNYETDYSFLVAFNSIIRDIKQRLDNDKS